MDEDDENECPWESGEGDENEKYEKNVDVDEDAKNIFDAYKDDSNSTENMNSREIASKFLKRLKRLAEKRKLDELLQFLDDNAGFVAMLKDDKKLQSDCFGVRCSRSEMQKLCVRDDAFESRRRSVRVRRFVRGVFIDHYRSRTRERFRFKLTVFEWWKKGRVQLARSLAPRLIRTGRCSFQIRFYGTWTMSRKVSTVTTALA